VAVPSDHDIILALGDDLPVGVWVARAPDAEFVYANRMFADLMGMGARSDVRVGGLAEAYGIHTRDGARYPERQLPFVRALAERTVVVADDLMIRRRDGRHVELRMIARPVGDPITHVIVVFFELSLELAVSPSQAARLCTPADVAPRTPRARDLILVVDDDPMVRKVIAGTLDSLGYQAVEAVSGKQALEVYRGRHAEIRAVVLDMVMPDMSGKATYLALRQIDCNVAVLLMSGHTLNAQVQEILDLGVRGFLSKPYSIAELAAAVAELTR
jgi:CheY-like chemotaxis protein